MRTVRADFSRFVRATQTTLDAHKRKCPTDAIAPLYASAFEQGRRYRELGAEFESHYSSMRVTGDQPRELFVGDAPVIGSLTPTDAEIIAACRAISASSGTYEVSGSTLTIRPIVAKNPGVMSGVSLTRTIQVMDGMLHLTSVPPWRPDIEVRYTYVPAR